MRKAFDSSDGVVEQIEDFVVVADDFVGNRVGKERGQKRTTVLDEALRDHVAQLWYQALVHEHFIELALLGVNQQASYRLIQVVEDLFEIRCSLDQRIIARHQVKDLEKAVNVAIGDSQCDDWTLDHEQREAALEQRFEEDLLFVRVGQISVLTCQG